MQRWIIAILILVSTLTLVAVVVMVRVNSSHKEIKWQEISEGVKVSVPSSEFNSAIIATDPATNAKILAPRAGLEDYSIPEFSLLNQGGEAVDHTIFEGRITILSFIFTNCLTACPPMTGNMLQVYHELEGTDVQFISISVDPVHDTPAQLTAYAARFGIDTDRWSFLTGAEGEAARVVRESLKFDILIDPDDSAVIELADGTSMSNIVHPIKFFLIGPDRQILDFCAPTTPADRDRLTEIARNAAE